MPYQLVVTVDNALTTRQEEVAAGLESLASRIRAYGMPVGEGELPVYGHDALTVGNVRLDES